MKVTSVLWHRRGSESYPRRSQHPIKTKEAKAPNREMNSQGRWDKGQIERGHMWFAKHL